MRCLALPEAKAVLIMLFLDSSSVLVMSEIHSSTSSWGSIVNCAVSKGPERSTTLKFPSTDRNSKWCFSFAWIADSSEMNSTGRRSKLLHEFIEAVAKLIAPLYLYFFPLFTLSGVVFHRSSYDGLVYIKQSEKRKMYSFSLSFFPVFTFIVPSFTKDRRGSTRVS